MCNIDGVNVCDRAKIICWYKWMDWVKQFGESSEKELDCFNGMYSLMTKLDLIVYQRQI
jgi:hypothetical protein